MADATTNTDARGVCCPECGFPESRVLGSYMPERGSRYRYRECVRCGSRFRTREMVDRKPRKVIEPAKLPELEA
jgi:transcriptional regulator NrdR family protein